MTTVNKKHFTTLYYPARERAMTKKNILAGWAKSGLLPFNPDRVFRDIAKPVPDALALLPVHAACEGSGPHPQDTIAQTAVTPVSSEALASLLTLVKQDPHDEISTTRHRKLVQKLANAAEVSFAQQALDQDQIQLLSKMNDEARTRRKTKSEILGKGKARVMSYEDIEAARAKRAEQEANKQAQGNRKRGRPKHIAVEAVVEGEAEATADKGTRKKLKRAQEAEEALALQVSVAHVAEESAPQPYRAPVARMW
jgi:hypothetical protein